MTRIVAGSAGGRRLAVPRGAGTRPTTDRAREALFATLGTLTDLDGARVLDLYAGSGAVGLEALSRGAATAVLVESDREAARVVSDNVRTLGLTGARVVRSPVRRYLASGPNAASTVAGTEAGASGPGGPGRHLGNDGYDVVFADPPYTLPDSEVAAMLADLVAGRWLADDAVVVVERASRGNPPDWPAGIEPIKERRYGEGALWYGRRP